MRASTVPRTTRLWVAIISLKANPSQWKGVSSLTVLRLNLGKSRPGLALKVLALFAPYKLQAVGRVVWMQ